MALVINTNVASLNAQRNLSKTQGGLSKSLERLSSGFRVNRAADDAAGLAISESMKAQIRGLAQAERNANDGISLVQTAEGAMNEIGNMLGRMRELAVQASTETITDTDRDKLVAEYDALVGEIDRIEAVTEFNGTSLLDGAAVVEFQVGIDGGADNQITATLDQALDAAGLGLAAGDIDGADGDTAQAFIATLDAAIETVAVERADLGAIQNRLDTTISNLSTARENLSAANSRIRDVDVAAESAMLTKNSILQQAAVSVLAQANQTPQLALSLLG